MDSVRRTNTSPRDLPPPREFLTLLLLLFLATKASLFLSPGCVLFLLLFLLLLLLICLSRYCLQYERQQLFGV